MLDNRGIKHRSHIQGHHENYYEPYRENHLTNHDAPDTYHKKQHFVHGKGGGGSPSNRMIYGGPSVPDGLNQYDGIPRRRQNFYASQMPRPETYPSRGFLYGMEDHSSPQINNRPHFNSLYEERTSAELRKRDVQRREKDEAEEMHKLQKQKQIKDRSEEQKRDLVMLQNYKPWGKPGGGAPNKAGAYDNNRTREVGRLMEDSDQMMPFGRPGGGAPNRSDSGKVKAALKSDPEVQLQTKKEGKNHHLLAEKLHLKENAKIANPHFYRTELDKLAEESRNRRSRERENGLEADKRMIEYNPYGRPGGGAPMRDSDGQVKAGFSLQLSNDIQQLRDVENRHPHAFNNLNGERPEEFDFDTFRKGHEYPNTNNKKNKMSDGGNSYFESKQGGGGAPRRDKDGKIISGIPQSLVKKSDGLYVKHDHSENVYRDLDDEYGLNYHPWGRAGAGAPIIDDHGKVKTQVAGKVQEGKLELSPKDKSQKNKEYLATLKQMDENVKAMKSREREDLLQETQPVATWVRRGMVGQPKYDPVTHEIIADPLVTSDVTRTKMQIRTQKSDRARDYHNDLSKQEQDKKKKYKQERQDEIKDSVRHEEKMNSYFEKQKHDEPNNRRRNHELQPSNPGITYRY